MQELQIKLTGTISSTNFDEWKSGLILEIKSINRNLVTDNDFDEASRHVKSFKVAEKALKDAKQSAINQAYEIQQLFSSIDEITEEARRARLSLDKQIKVRKKEIKEGHIQSGIDAIKAVIEQQPIELKECDVSRFLDRGRYESAVYGRKGTRGLETGINEVTSIVREEIAAKVQQINNNKIKLDALLEGHKILFQDYGQLVCWPSEQLDREIDKRIYRYESELKSREEESSVRDQDPCIDGAVENKQVDADAIAQKDKYRIVIQLEATAVEANNLTEKIKKDYGAWVRSVALSHDG